MNPARPSPRWRAATSSLPTLTVEAGAEDDVAYLPRFMKDLHAGSLPVEAGAIASVMVSPARGIEIYLEDREMRLSIATDDWTGNLARIGLTLGDRHAGTS